MDARDLKTTLERQLYLEVQREMDIQKEHERRVDNLVRKLDSMQNLKHEYDTLRKERRELESICEEQQRQHIQMQKSIEAEAIYLATQKANLEEENESLLNILDQRDYEVQILNQQLQLQQRHANATGTGHGRVSDAASDGSNMYNIQYMVCTDLLIFESHCPSPKHRNIGCLVCGLVISPLSISPSISSHTLSLSLCL